MKHRIECKALLTGVAMLFTLLAQPVEAAERYTFVSQWGGLGSAPGAFQYPFGLAVDNACNVYVADAGNNRIQKFSSVGAVLGYWGTAGSGSGQLDFPQGIAVDPLNAVYVTDTNNHRIQKFSTSGIYLGAWGQHGSANGYFDYPTGVAAEPYGFGSIYVAEPLVLSDSSNHRVQQFTYLGGFVSKWPGLVSPQDVAVDRAGNVFVLDDNKVVKYTNSGAILAQWGSEGTGAGQFDLPAGLCVDGLGNVYVADTGNHRIQKFTNTGTFLVQWGNFGTASGQFRFPADVAVDDSGSVYVSDQVNHRIQKFSPRRVLLVHGICGDAAGWDPFAQVLADSSFSVERLQYGDPNFSLRPAAYVNALAAKLDAMGPGPVAVVAHSMGGLIAREYIRRQAAAGRPNRISQLVTLGSPHHGSDLLAKVLGWGPGVDGFLGPIFGPCLSSRYSVPALLDMVPGAWYLNRLNYGDQTALFDSAPTHGWGLHQSETTLPSNIYIASVGGTGSFCDPVVRGFLWPKSPAYHLNDCTVATGSSVLSNSSVFRAADAALGLEKPAAHTDDQTEPCGEAYYSFGTLAKRVATILLTSPAAPPLSVSGDESAAIRLTSLATVEDSLQMTPVIEDSVGAGQVISRTVALPATSLVRFTLFSSDAHIVLVDPNGAVITVADTSSASGVAYFATSRPGCEGFEIVSPIAGTWTMRGDATGSAAGQRIAGLVEYASASAVQLAVPTEPLHPGDAMRIRAEMTTSGTRRSDVSWVCGMRGPDGSTSSITLYDDGAHADSLVADGIYGNTVVPGGGVGQYALTASATAPSIGPLASTAYCEVADTEDLAIYTSDIQLSKNVPQAGDSLTVLATLRNNSSKAALGIDVQIRDLRTGAVLGSSLVDLGAGSAVVVQIPWVPAAPDSHELQVQITPYVLDESNYANNTASRVIVLGAPVGVEFGGSAAGLRFYPPRPNPTSHDVVLSFSVPQRGTATLEIYDIGGRRVREWRWTSLDSGTHAIAWDGRGPSGQLLSPGVYLCRLSVGDDRLQRKVILRH